MAERNTAAATRLIADGLRHPSIPATDVVREIVGHLGAALGQTLPSDDQIIVGHIREAHTLATALLRAQRAAAEGRAA